MVEGEDWKPDAKKVPPHFGYTSWMRNSSSLITNSVYLAQSEQALQEVDNEIAERRRLLDRGETPPEHNRVDNVRPPRKYR